MTQRHQLEKELSDINHRLDELWTNFEESDERQMSPDMNYEIDKLYERKVEVNLQLGRLED